MAGVDEAGRGPWAGPVVAAAVVLVPGSIPASLNDSKALSPARREAIYESLITSGAEIGVGIADVARIDDMNILQATFWAMQQAISKLPRRPAIALIDGNRVPRLSIAARALVGGDALCLSIAAASIVAKVTRDRIMCDLAIRYAGYGFERHKGYGTPEHQLALDLLGPCAEHRKSFSPVRIVIDRMSVAKTHIDC